MVVSVALVVRVDLFESGEPGALQQLHKGDRNRNGPMPGARIPSHLPAIQVIHEYPGTLQIAEELEEAILLADIIADIPGQGIGDQVHEFGDTFEPLTSQHGGLSDG